MKQKNFINQLAHAEIVAAIRDAEKKTSGEIRVFVCKKIVGDPVAAAHTEFHRLGMTQTKHRNAVLIYVAPAAQKFAVVGDVAVHQHCGQNFWDAVAAEISRHFAQGKFSDGIIHGVQRAGQMLAQPFPPLPGDKNELPDKVETD
jgi:uncharacterized membrane protein